MDTDEHRLGAWYAGLSHAQIVHNKVSLLSTKESRSSSVLIYVYLWLTPSPTT